MNEMIESGSANARASLRPQQFKRSFRGEARAVDFRCRGCGYQIAIAEPHPVCPMCSRRSWAPLTSA
jgi:rubrerythrin